MSLRQILTAPMYSLILLFLVASTQIAVLECLPTSTTQDQLGQSSSTSPCESSNSPECTSASPPQEQLCKTHQKGWDRSGPTCDLVKAMKKNSAGTLEHSDIADCYRPQCDQHNGQYLAKQCSLFFKDWCWCSSPDGIAIPDTFQRNMPNGYCTNQPTKCSVDGTLYDADTVFTPLSVCGLCECHSNGTHTCFIEYTVDANDRLSSDQVETLKRDLIQVFNYQHNHTNGHAIVNVKEICGMPSEVTDAQKEMILGWKFDYYDRNEDDGLSRVEEFVFHEELAQLFGCNKFFDHLTELMDKNKDSEISLQEWNAFFGLAILDSNPSGEMPTQLVKREVPLNIRKPLHLRKKFQYVIS